MKKKPEREGLRTWIEIDARAIRSNFRAFRRLVSKDVRMAGVVKSNAYGHGFIEFAYELEQCGIDMLVVDSLVEALALRKAGILVDILVLGYTLPELFSKAARKNIHLTISSVEGLRTFLKHPQARSIPIHLKVDTGMHRQGFMYNEMPQVLKLLAKEKTSVRVVGLYTHFAEAKDLEDRAFTEKQIAEFELWRAALLDAGFSPTTHAGATGGTLFYPTSHFDMVRVGAGLYGFWSSQAIPLGEGKSITLHPVLSWKTMISEVKEIARGESVGYDLTHVAEKTTRIAVCPVGYWHGYPRALSNNAEVLVRGLRAKVLGRISMDMIVIDVTEIPRVKMGDEVVLIGRSGSDEVSANELAEHAGTSAYEILTRLNPLIKRIYK